MRLPREAVRLGLGRHLGGPKANPFLSPGFRASYSSRSGLLFQRSKEPLTSPFTQTTTNGTLSWRLVLSLGTFSLFASVVYANRPAPLRFDALAPAGNDELRASRFHRDLSSAKGPILATRVTPSDLEKDASVDGISHRNGDDLTTLASIDPERLTQILRKNEQAVVVGGGTGVLRYDTNQIASNCPIEDDHSEAIIAAPSQAPGKPSGDWMFWGVYDGHSGWSTSAKLRQSLISHVYLKLAEAYASTAAPSDSEIDNAIKAGFVALDNDIVLSNVEKAKKLGTKHDGAQLLAPAISGSCALLSFYDTRSKLLRVACTGDCRAVLGRRAGGLKWSATQLSSDQTGENPDEAARVTADHPGEKDVVKNGRVLGYEPSRVFGDAVLKWPRELSLSLRQAFYARWPQPKIITPPYMTAEPLITTTKIEPEHGDFIVIGSDALWEMLSNEEVIGLVGRWIDQGRLGIGRQAQRSFWDMLPKFSGSGDGLDSNVVSTTSPNSDPPFRRPPTRPAQWGITKRSRVPVVQDVNVATHVARNALGGDDHDLISSLFLLGGSNARRFRDDLTVTVVFFGNEE
ncbi:phosphatase 2C-like domain-containing protein [Immersiella caudata]|uniref:Phosphatase 2C-like domain-containing protein n=1 Tax=Immersiella caudata TaxID=314043 RepID=A0AA39WPZ4_9PEZI|nr:phosphatase 2C-like domain-containing protein [Immersiella caudata]